MATLYVRQIPERLYRQARRIAVSQGRSLSAYVVEVLQQAVQDDKVRRSQTETLARIRRRRRPLPRKAPDSVAMIRQIRTERE